MSNTSQLIGLYIALRGMVKNNYFNREITFKISTRTHHVIYEHREREPQHVTYGFCHVNCLEGGATHSVSLFGVHDMEEKAIRKRYVKQTFSI